MFLKQNGSIHVLVFFLPFGKLTACILLSIPMSSCTLNHECSGMLRKLQEKKIDFLVITEALRTFSPHQIIIITYGSLSPTC